MILLPETELTSARRTAERIRIAVESGAGITVSLGVASYKEDIHEKEEIVKMADDAMYLAKQKGRNRIELYRENKTSSP